MGVDGDLELGAGDLVVPLFEIVGTSLLLSLLLPLSLLSALARKAPPDKNYRHGGNRRPKHEVADVLQHGQSVQTAN